MVFACMMSPPVLAFKISVLALEIPHMLSHLQSSAKLATLRPSLRHTVLTGGRSPSFSVFLLPSHHLLPSPPKAPRHVVHGYG
jgi:hypothetical protein